MATPISVACPQCKQQIKASDELVGKKVRCKACSHIFVISAASIAKPGQAKAAPAKSSPAKPAPVKAKVEEEDDPNPYTFSDAAEAVPRCPHCANELESADAVLCIHCGYNTTTRQRVESKKIVEKTGGDQFMWLLPGLLAVLFVLLLIGVDLVYCFLLPRWLKDGDFEFLGANGFKLWIVIMSLFGMFFAGKFAVKRLILNPTPPEKVRG